MYEAWGFLCISIATGERETCVWSNNEQISLSKEIPVFQCRNKEQHYLFACQVNFIPVLNMGK